VLVDEAEAPTGRIHEALDEARDDLRDGVSAYREVLASGVALEDEGAGNKSRERAGLKRRKVTALVGLAIATSMTVLIIANRDASSPDTGAGAVVDLGEWDQPPLAGTRWRRHICMASTCCSQRRLRRSGQRR
jgi:hypothetical protein